MIRYKHQTHKSNYLTVEINAGINYQSEDGSVSIHCGVCTLKLILTPGEHTISGEYEAGTADGKPVMGEMIFHYCIDAGDFVICDYNFEQKLDDEAPDYYKCLEFRLVKKERDKFREQEEEVLMQVSARCAEKYFCSLGKEMVYLVKDCRKQLRKAYKKINQVLAEARISVYIKLGEILQYDECGRIVGGTAIGTTTFQQNQVFYNMVQTSYDRPSGPGSGGASWLGFYHTHTQQNRRKCCARNVGGACTPSTVAIQWRYKGAHIARTPSVSVPTTPNVSGNRKFDQTFRYHLLPLCASHNAQGGLLQMTCQPSDGVLPVRVLELNCFRSNVYWP